MLWYNLSVIFLKNNSIHIRRKTMFNITVSDTYEEVSKEAAEVMLEVVKGTEKPVLGLATGSSPVGLYQEMIRDHKENGTSYKDIITFNLDEYYPIKKTNTQSYDFFMQKNLFSKINIKRENTYIPNGETKNPQKECENYDNLIKLVKNFLNFQSYNIPVSDKLQ